MLPQWAVTLLLTAIIAPIITAIIAPIVVARLQRRRDVAETGLVEAQTKKTDVESIAQIAETTAELLDTLHEQMIYQGQRFAEYREASEKKARNLQRQLNSTQKQLDDARSQISIMSETIQSMVARIRALEADVKLGKQRESELHAANLRLIEQVEHFDATDGAVMR